MRRSDLLTVLFTITIFGGFVLFSLKFFFNNSAIFYDFGAYYQAANLALAGKPVYGVWLDKIPNTANRWLYPPFALLVIIPYTVFPFKLAAVAWDISTIIVFSTGIFVLIRDYRPDLPFKLHVTIIAACILSYPLIYALHLGQVVPLLVGIFALAGSYTINSGQSEVIGGITGFAGTVKAQYLPIGTFLLYDYRRVVSAAFTLTFLFSLGSLLFGVESNSLYMQTLAQGEGWGTGRYDLNRWRPVMFQPFFVFHPYQLIIKSCVVVLTAIISLWCVVQKDRSLEQYVFSLALLTIPLADPIPNAVALGPTIPAIIILYFEELNRKQRTEIPILGAILISLHPFVLALFTTDGILNITLVGPLASILHKHVEVLPYIQPALWGVLSLYFLTLQRCYQG